MDPVSLKEEQSFQDENIKEEDEIVDEESLTKVKKGVYVLEVNQDLNCDEILKKDEPQKEEHVSKNRKKAAEQGVPEELKELVENSGESSIDSNIEFLNQDEANLDESDDDNKENTENAKQPGEIDAKTANRRANSESQRGDFAERQHLLLKENLSLSYLDRSIDRSKTSIDDLSFSQKTLIKSCSLRSLITDLINDEILLDKNELSKDLDEFEKEKFFQIIKVIKQEDSEKKVEQLKELCEYSNL